MNEINFNLENVEDINFSIDIATKEIYPPLINLEVFPNSERQVFNHEGNYGYDEVVVNKIEDVNLIAENIRDGVNILGVEGNFAGKKYSPRMISFRGYTGTELNEEITSLDTSKITDFRYMFYDNQYLTSIPYLDTSNGTNFASMFFNDFALKSIPLIDTSKATSLNSMFYACRALTEIPQINTGNGTDFASMFYQCQALTKIPQLNTSNATSLGSMFFGCNKLTEIPQFDTSKATNLYGTFNSCSALTTIAELDLSSCTNLTNMLYNCTKLVNLGGFKNLGQAYLTTNAENYSSYKLDLSKSTLLTHDSLMNVINKLYDIASIGVKSQTLVLGATNLAKLNEEEINIAVSKGWNVS